MNVQDTDKQQIQQLYETMYQAMIAKDTATLNHVYADEMVLIHMTGRSRVTAAVFGGGRSNWRLQLRFKLVKREGLWLFTEASAGTY